MMGMEVIFSEEEQSQDFFSIYFQVQGFEKNEASDYFQYSPTIKLVFGREMLEVKNSKQVTKRLQKTVWITLGNLEIKYTTQW